MPYVHVWVDTSDVLQEVDTDDLESELKSRSRKAGGDQDLMVGPSFDSVTGKTADQLLDAIYENRRAGKDERVLALMDRWLYLATGRIV